MLPNQQAEERSLCRPGRLIPKTKGQVAQQGNGVLMCGPRRFTGVLLSTSVANTPGQWKNDRQGLDPSGMKAQVIPLGKKLSLTAAGMR